MSDPVNNPKHYNSHPAGIECIEIARWFAFSRGNAIKYLWRAGLKGAAVEDLKKARWYVCDAREKEPDFDLPDAWNGNVSGKLMKACAGFENPVVGSAILHIANEEWPMALRCIDALIAEAEPKDAKKEEAA